MKRQINLIAIAAILVVIFGTVYAAVQQAQRSDANSPQIQMSEDAAAQIEANKDPHVSSLLSPVDMSRSLAPFTIVYDGKGNVVAGSGYLGKKVPKVPLDLLKASKGKTYHAVTWQPQTGVRIATATVAAEVPASGKTAAKDYYVMSGRSLAEVEKNENRTLWIAVAGGVLSLVVVAAAVVAKSVLPVQSGRRQG